MNSADELRPLPDDARTQWLLRYQAWLKLLARLEIDRRFQGKFSESDAVQQTLFEAWRCWDRFQGDEEPARLAWLRQILAHQLAHLARRYGATQKRDAAREQSLDQSLAQSAHRLRDVLAADQSTPSAALQREEQSLQLAAALDRLPSDYREVLVLRNLEELSHDEIATRLGRSPGAVRMLWLRALAALRTEFLRDATSTGRD
ncbi:MAG: sigma-70 family RNA polymerase sigma factor [Pirellulales bacterium]